MKILKNANVLNPCESKLLKGVSIVIENGLIKELTEEETEGDEVFDLQGKLVLPGLINAHTHLYSSLARGMPIKGKPRNFVEILKEIWWRLDFVLDEEDVYWSALVGAVEAVKRGVTLLVDHHASPNFIVGSLDIIEEALKKVGIRGILSYEVTDRHGREGAKKGIEENLRYAKKHRENEFFGASFGLHASFTLGDETLMEAREAESEVNTGFHVHIAEDLADIERSANEYKGTPIERFLKFGILKNKSLLIHGVHLKEEELAKVNEKGAFLVVNPSSNMNNAVGLPPIIDMLNSGITVGLGTDGLGQDMMNEMRNTMLAIKIRERDPRLGFREAIQLLFCNNPRIASGLLPLKFGKIDKGYVADFTILRYNSPTPLTEENAGAHLIYGIPDFEIDSVMVNGNFIFQDGKFINLDELEVKKKAAKVAGKIWDKLYG